MSNNPTSQTLEAFDSFDSALEQQGIVGGLDFLEQHHREVKDFYGLFEVLKMKCRQRMGLPLSYGAEPDDISEEKRRELEDSLLESCREVGKLFFDEGRIEEGWMYLQPLGDQAFVESLIRKVEINEESLNAIIDVCLHQGVAPGYGYKLLLEHTGTCNGITAFDVQGNQFDKPTRIELASLLLNHLYNDLMINVRNHVEEVTKTDPGDQTLGELLVSQDWLVHDGGHHTDATHLASGVRIARLVESAEDIQKAVELSAYGTRLAEDFHYASEPPFESTYDDHLLYFQALAGIEVDSSIAHFHAKAESLEEAGHGSLPWEVLIDLLVRIGRRDEALEIAIEKLIGDSEPGQSGIAPGVFEIPETPEQFEKLSAVFRERGELLGFAIGKLKATT